MITLPDVAPAVKLPVELLILAKVEVVLQLPAPTLVVLVRLIIDPAQTEVGPTILPALGRGFTKMIFCVLSDPQDGVVTLYLIVTLPADTAVTMPVALTVATEGLDDIQPPPEVPVLLSEIVLPAQRLSAPVIDPGLGRGLIVIFVVSVVLPQEAVVAV